MRLLFASTALTGAFLLFLVEPMFARMVLPLLGGAPAVWNTCLVFYQFALLGGYLYAHGVSRQPQRRQVLLQAGLLLVAALALPIAVHGGTPPPSANPIGWVFRILVVSLGLPFVVLATTGPLLQRWYASLGSAAARTVYSLFAASNVGSFVALLGYPFLIEPLLRLHTQSTLWAAGYAVYAGLMLACGIVVWRHAPAQGAVAQGEAQAVPAPVPEPARKPKANRRAADTIAEEPDVWAERLRWLGLAAVPSTLMMSVTTFISTDVAAMPLLWVVPLALYLLTFILAFAERRLIGARPLERLFAVAVVLSVALVIAPPLYPLSLIAAHLTCFFIVALACHTALADSRPPAASLTEFYLWLSAGGALGGLFNALVAPLVFVNPFEYPLAALSACLLMPNAFGADEEDAPSTWRQVASFAVAAIPVALVAVLVRVVQHYDAQLPTDAFLRFLLIFGPGCLVAFALQRTPLRMGLSLATLVVASTFVLFDNRVPIHFERDFFGLHRVVFTGKERLLLSGTTNHGGQSMDPALKCEPLTYYSKGGPVGQIFDRVSADHPSLSVGVVGLGTATLGAYAQPSQRWTFFEINPAVERLARDTAYFTFLRDCAPQATVVTGDARLMMASQPEAGFDVLVLDAFSSDAIPVHLITLEAMQVYLQKLAPHGLMAVHISNRYLNLAPVIAATSRAAGLVSAVQTHVPSAEAQKISVEISPSRWVLVGRSADDLEPLTRSGRWSSLDDAEGPVWTDDYSNVLGVLAR